MASFLNDFGGEAKKNLREGFEQNTGVLGQALRERRMREERKKRTEKEVASIQEGIGKLRLASNSLFNIERSFLQISRNVQLIAKAMDAQVTLQKESDKLAKQLTDISQTKQQTAKPEPKQQAAIEKIGDQKEEQSLLSKIGDLVDNFEKKRRTGRTPQKRTPRGRANRLKRLSKVNLGRAARVLGRVGTTAARFSPVASVAAYGYGAYKASEFLEKTNYGASMQQGAGQTAERAFRNKDTSYGTDLTPDQARAILEQPDSPAKQRDIKAFGGLEKIQAIANIQQKVEQPETKPETKPTLPVSSAGGGRGVVNPALVKPREERVQPTQVWVDSEGRPITTGTGEIVQAAPAAQPVKPIPPPPPPAPAAKPPVAATPVPSGSAEPLVKKISAQSGRQAMIDEMDKQGITDPVKRAAIMAQAAVETGGFQFLSENLAYSAGRMKEVFGRLKNTPMETIQQAIQQGVKGIGTLVYGGDPSSPSYQFGVKQLGNVQPGDGFRYRGRGFFQLTGRSNYTKAGVADQPEKLLDLKPAAETAVNFANRYKGSYDDVNSFTRFVNGGLTHVKERGEFFNKFLDDPSITKANATSGKEIGNASTNVAAAKRGSTSAPNVTVIAVTNQQTIKKPAGMPARKEYPTPVAA